MKPRRPAFSAVIALVATAGIAAGSAPSASAVTTEFESSGAGSLSAKALETQVFTTSAGKWECGSVAATEAIAAGDSPTLDAEVTYSECTFFGEPASFSPVDYEFHASGAVTIRKPATVTIDIFGTEACRMTFPAQTVSTLAYKNLSNGNLEIVPVVAGIASEGAGSLCEYNETGNAAKGTYEGAFEVHDSGGSIGLG